MEVIIFSQNKNKSKKLQNIIDRIIMDKRLRLMSIHTITPLNADELFKCLKTNKSYLIIFDITNYCEWKQIINNISNKYRHIKFCVLAESNDAAPELINMMVDICGYINTMDNTAMTLIAELFVRLYSRLQTLAGGILCTADTGELKVINFDEIYYIETLKQQHKCNVVHVNGVDIIRADISKLINNLDSRFEISRSSTIANLSKINCIFDGLIMYENGICCSVTQQRLASLKKIMQMNAIV